MFFFMHVYFAHLPPNMIFVPSYLVIRTQEGKQISIKSCSTSLNLMLCQSKFILTLLVIPIVYASLILKECKSRYMLKNESGNSDLQRN